MDKINIPSLTLLKAQTETSLLIFRLKKINSIGELLPKMIHEDLFTISVSGQENINTILLKMEQLNQVQLILNDTINFSETDLIAFHSQLRGIFLPPPIGLSIVPILQ